MIRKPYKTMIVWDVPDVQKIYGECLLHTVDEGCIEDNPRWFRFEGLRLVRQERGLNRSCSCIFGGRGNIYIIAEKESADPGSSDKDIDCMYTVIGDPDEVDRLIERLSDVIIRY